MIGYPLDSHVTYDGNGIPIYDRAVSSAPLRKIIKKLFSDGVMPNPSTNMQVVADAGMNILVKSGFAICNGCVKLEEEQVTLAVQESDASHSRIDTVALRLNDNDAVRSCELVVLTGTPAANPVRPALTRDASIWEIGLADVKVPANATSITNANITDTRYETARCGVISSISKFDTTKIYQQVLADLAEFKTGEQAEFLAWFENIKKQLSTDAAGNLQNQIAVERERINNLAKMEEGSTTGDAELQDIRVDINGHVYPTAGDAVRGQLLDVYTYIDNAVQKSELYPVTFADVRVDTAFTIRGPYVLGETRFADVLGMMDSEGYCVYEALMNEGDTIILSNAFDLTSLYNQSMVIIDTNGIIQGTIPFDELKREDRYGKKYTFRERCGVYLCFDSSEVQAGEFFYIKRAGTSDMLVLDAKLTENYLGNSTFGDAALNAILNSKQILVRVPNNDGGDYTAIYSPIYMYQLPNRMNRYLYLFYLTDAKQDIDLSALGMGVIQMPVYGELKMLLSRDYNASP